LGNLRGPNLRFGHRNVPAGQLRFFRTALLGWWSKAKRDFPWRRKTASVYHQIVSEALLQRTRAETVAAFWPQFVKQFPSWNSIANATILEVEVALQPIGLARQRAPRLHALATFVSKTKGRFPDHRSKIEELPGVGQYIANAILSFHHGKPHPLLDVNMARVVERFFAPRRLADIRYDPYLQELTTYLVQHDRGKHINWAILDLGALICTARLPQCHRCPLAKRCCFALRKIEGK
jgi:A/G-specific adenine glycosylase